MLSGGRGSDRFDFDSVADSRPGATRDTIINFHHGQGDRIDLSGIDANNTLTKNQAFNFIGASTFHDVAGELRFSNGLLQGDIDGDGAADFQVYLSGVNFLVRGDFIL